MSEQTMIVGQRVVIQGLIGNQFSRAHRGTVLAFLPMEYSIKAVVQTDAGTFREVGVSVLRIDDGSPFCERCGRKDITLYGAICGACGDDLHEEAKADSMQAQA